MFVNELQDGAEIDQVLLVREAERRQRRDGGDYLRLRLGDRTGAVVVDGVGGASARSRSSRGRARRCACAAATPCIPGSARRSTCAGWRRRRPGATRRRICATARRTPWSSWRRSCASCSATVRRPHLRELLERLIGEDSELWSAYRVAPAAKHYHQAYRHGLLEHCLSVAQAVSATSATFGGIDRDVAVTGALLHDIGKLEAYTEDPGAIDLTDAGRLQGEIALGYYRVRRTIEEIEGFPAELAQAVTHIILSHHGSLEHGSPVVPCTREATLVHMIDNLGGRLGSFDRLEKELAPGRRWSGYDRALEGSAFFAGHQATSDDAGRARTPGRRLRSRLKTRK